MHITVVPASPKTGQAVIRALLLSHESPPTVHGVYRDLAKVPEEFSSNPSFKAVRGDVGDASTLDFGGSDAVLAITPPRYDGADIIEHAKSVSVNTRAAIEKSGTVKRLVLISSGGAQYDHGTGEIGANHAAEVVLRDAAPEVVFVRCAYFMENWATALQTVKSENPFFYSTITPLDYKIPMIAVEDIGKACAAQLLAAGEDSLPFSPFIFDLFGPEYYSPQDVQRAFAAASGKEVKVKPVEPDQLASFFAQVFPPSTVHHWVEMATSFLPGGIMENDITNPLNVQRGEMGLEDAIKRLYQSG